MPSIITTKTRIHSAQQFSEALGEASPNNLFMFIGKVSPWVDDNDPPRPDDTDANERLIWKDMIGGKQIGPANVSHVIRRYDWTSGEVYVRYDDAEGVYVADEDIYIKKFYVLTDDFHVYKCIDNNAGGTSTVKPTGTGTSIITLGDGYKWKYMYTVDTASALKFLTPNWIPVKELLADDGSNQWIVQNNTIDGGIHAIGVVAGGSGYTSPPAVIIDGDGTGATATATVSGGTVTKIEIDAPGTGYTEATITLVGGGFTIAASARLIFSPAGGHGYHALKELGGFYVMLNTKFEEDENGDIPVTNDFRKIGILRDPFEYGTETISNATTFNQTTRLEVDGGYTGTFSPDEMITGTVSGAEGQVVKFDSVNNIIHVNEITGTFQVSEGVTTAGGSGTVVVITNPDLEPRSGDLIFIENRVPIARAIDQTEQVRVILEF